MAATTAYPQHTGGAWGGQEVGGGNMDAVSKEPALLITGEDLLSQKFLDRRVRIHGTVISKDPQTHNIVAVAHGGTQFFVQAPDTLVCAQDMLFEGKLKAPDAGMQHAAQLIDDGASKPITIPDSGEFDLMKNTASC